MRAQERRRGSSNRTSSVTHFAVGSEDNVFQLYVHGKLFPNPSISLFFFGAFASYATYASEMEWTLLRVCVKTP